LPTSPGLTPGYQWVFEAQNVTQVNDGCIAAYAPSNEQWRCFFAEYTLPHITTPLFVRKRAPRAEARRARGADVAPLPS